MAFRKAGYEQLCEVHIFFRHVELLHLLPDRFPIKVIHDNAVPGYPVPFRQGQKVSPSGTAKPPELLYCWLGNSCIVMLVV